MQILFNEQSRTFHLTNDKISYIMTVLPNGHLSQVRSEEHTSELQSRE